MKKWMMTLALVLAALLMVSCCGAEAAVKTTYHLEDARMSLDLDSDIPVYIAGSEEIDEAYTKLGMTKEQMDNMLRSNAIIMHALINNGANEMMVSAAMVEELHLDDATAEEAQVLLDTIKAQFSNVGAEVTESNVVETEVGKALCFRYQFRSGMITQFTTQYSLMDHGRMANLRLSSYTGALTPAEEDWLLEVVNSVKWDDPSLALPTPEATPIPEGNATYHLAEAKLTMELPARFPAYIYGSDTIGQAYLNRGITKSSLDGIMSANSMIFHSLVLESDEMIVTPAMEVGELTAEMEPEILEAFVGEFEALGASITEKEAVDTAAGRAFLIRYVIDMGTVSQYVTQYSVIHGTELVNLRLCSYTAVLNEEEEGILLDAVNSIVWDE